MIKNMMTVMLLLVGNIPALYAQYNPTNPPEPEENIYYKVSVVSSPEAAANTSGTGNYLQGTQVNVRYSLKNPAYTFSHWTINGERYDSNSNNFMHTVVKDDQIVAHFKYTPSSPLEPSSKDEHKLFIEASSDGACSFNITSGLWTEYDKYVTLTTYPNQGYEFLGWYRNGMLVSSDKSFNYLMPDEEVTLVAKYKYNPSSPLEPEGDGSQSNVQTTHTGDVNKDGVIDILDIISVANYTFSEGDENKSLYDVNGDGEVDILDIIKTANLSFE